MAHACSKTFLSLLNSLLTIFGIVLIILSLYLYKKYHSVQLIIGVIILAFVVIFIGLLGFIGTFKESKCALFIYIILVGVITLALLALLIILCMKQTLVINQILDNYETHMTNSKLLNDEKNVNITRDLFIKLQCCGFKERNEPQKIFHQIDFCNHINQSKPLCNEKMKNDLQQNLIAIITLYTIVTGLGALACIVAIHLACTTSTRTRHSTFQSQYH